MQMRSGLRGRIVVSQARTKRKAKGVPLNNTLHGAYCAVIGLAMRKFLQSLRICWVLFLPNCFKQNELLTASFFFFNENVTNSFSA